MRTLLFAFGASAMLIAGLSVVPRDVLADIGSASYQILGPALSPGGYSTSPHYSLLATFGEFAHDLATSASFTLRPGFPGFPLVSTPAVSATGGNATAALTWTPAQAFLGYTVAGYSVGQATTPNGPFTYTAVGNVLSYTASGLTNGITYYFVVRVLDQQGTVLTTSAVTSAVPTAPPPPPPAGGGGGGGGGGAPPPSGSGTATINVSGRAYPGSTVVLLKDGQIAVSSIAGGDANFSFKLSNLSAGQYTFSVYAIDSKQMKSNLLPFSAMLTDGAATTISGLFLSPTIAADKSSVKRGDNITFFGQAAASSSVVISVHSNPEYFVSAPTDRSGGYLYVYDSSPLDLGDHLAKSKAVLTAAASNFSGTVGFAVGDTNQAPSGTCGPNSIFGDLNCDGKVNLVDFSIMAYWYNRPLVGAGLTADLNHDRKVNLVDFSIMLYHWTG